MLIDLTDIGLEIRVSRPMFWRRTLDSPSRESSSPIWQLDQLENFTDRSNGKKILGLGIFKIRVTQADTPDQTILQ